MSENDSEHVLAVAQVEHIGAFWCTIKRYINITILTIAISIIQILLKKVAGKVSYYLGEKAEEDKC